MLYLKYKIILLEKIKMKIPSFLNKDNYLQNPIMRRFLKQYNIKFVETRAEYIHQLEEFSNINEENETILKNWLLKIVKEGSKEICYKKLYHIKDTIYDISFVEQTIQNAYPNCPMSNILEYKNTNEFELVDYHIITNDNDKTQKIEFTFSRFYLCGEIGRKGEAVAFPIFIEVYLEDGFIVSRAKAKSTLFPFDGQNFSYIGESRIDTMDTAEKLMNDIIKTFDFTVEVDSKKVKNINSRMLYKLYCDYSFTPADVESTIDTQNNLIDTFVDQLFKNLCLDIRNKEKALLDARILVEKFISINGNNEEIFTKDRPAYLIKISSNDENELTTIDAKSSKSIPLQTTEAFFDSKKSVIQGKMCKKLSMVFKRKDETYFTGYNQQLEIQFGSKCTFGFFKTIQYAEEEDIQNVLQTIFRNY